MSAACRCCRVPAGAGRRHLWFGYIGTTTHQAMERSDLVALHRAIAEVLAETADRPSRFTYFDDTTQVAVEAQARTEHRGAQR